MENQWILTGVSVLLGALITWGASYRYYKKAGDELHFEANKLREESLEINRLTNMVLRGLHNSKIIEVTWKGEKIVGLVIKLQGKAEAKTNISNPELIIDSNLNPKTGQ